MKNWLIRTKNLHILGPVSKDKVKELYLNGSIKGDDEIGSGNGYWFYVKESNLIERFLLNDEVQSFNPVREAADILTAPMLDESEILIPGDGDLEFPDLSLSDDEDLTDSSSASLEESTSDLKKKNNNIISKVMSEDRTGEMKNIKLKPPVHRNDYKKEKNYELISPKKSILTSNTLFSLIIVFLLLLIILFYYRGQLINSFKNSSNLSIFSSAYAQDVAVKKKE